MTDAGRYANPEKRRMYMREYMRRYNARPERKAFLKAHARQSYRTRAGFRMRIRRKYALADGQFDAMLIAQCGRCAICADAMNPASTAPHVDHDHATGRVRGLLCHGCNMGLGGFKDRPHALLAAVSYLDRV